MADITDCSVEQLLLTGGTAGSSNLERRFVAVHHTAISPRCLNHIVSSCSRKHTRPFKIALAGFALW
jgi:hypothetical protein